MVEYTVNQQYTEKGQLNDKPAMTNAQRVNYSSLHLLYSC